MPTAFITGVNSFLGATLARQLLDDGWQVRGLIRSGSNDILLQETPGIKRVIGDLLQPATWRDALSGCDALFHVAASFTHDPDLIPLMKKVNIEGTRFILQAAADANIPHILHTSTIGTIGQPQDGSLATEETPFNLPHPSAYVLSKRAGEQVARDLAAQGAPVIIVHPTAMLGPGDWRPTASGRIVLAFLHDRPLRYISGGINWTPVQDVARGMILALEKGQPGRRYILGHARGNLTEIEFRTLMARASGRPAPKPREARWKQQLRRLLKTTPPPHPQRHTGTSPQRLTCDPSRAITELGMPQSDLLTAARQEIAWFQKTGMW